MQIRPAPAPPVLPRLPREQRLQNVRTWIRATRAHVDEGISWVLSLDSLETRRRADDIQKVLDIAMQEQELLRRLRTLEMFVDDPMRLTAYSMAEQVKLFDKKSEGLFTNEEYERKCAEHAAEIEYFWRDPPELDRYTRPPPPNIARILEE